MFPRITGSLFVYVLLALLSLGPVAASGAVVGATPQAAWSQFDVWLSRSPSGDAWRKFLKTSDLEEHFRSGAPLSPQSVAATLERLRSGAPGLDEPRFRAVEQSLAEWLPQLAARTPLRTALDSAAAPTEFAPVGKTGLTWLRTAALKSQQTLDAYLAENPHRDGWRKFLAWEQVQAQLEGRTPADPRLLQIVADRLAAGHDARSIPEFSQFQAALTYYAQAMLANADADPRGAYSARQQQLRQRLAAFTADASYSNLESLATTMGEFEARGQAAGLTQSLRQQLFRPNLHFEASAPLVTYGTTRAVDRSSPVAECIDGTWVRGQGRTIGKVHGSLCESSQYALLYNHFQGQTYSNTLGFNSGATISSNGVTRFNAMQGVVFDGKEFRELPAEAHARTSTRTNWVDSGRDALACIADQIAWNRVQQRKGRSEYFAARSAEQKIKREFSEGVTEAVQRSDRNYRDKLLFWMLNQQVYPEDMQVSSDPAAVRIVATQGRPGQAGAPGLPPAAPSGVAMSLRVHESAINNAAATSLTDVGLLDRLATPRPEDRRIGRTLRRDEVRAAILKQFPNTKLKPVDPRQKPWEITFSSEQPLRVQFDGNRITITLRVRRFASDGQTPELPDGDLMVEAFYRIEDGPQGPVAVLEDRPLVWYSAPGQTKYRDYLGLWLGLGAWDWGTPGEILGALEELEFQLDDKQVFPQRIEGLIQLGGAWQGYGNLRPAVMHALDGWLTIGWKQVPKPELEVVKPVESTD